MMRPTKAAQMTTPMQLQQPESSRVNGVLVKSYKDIPGAIMVNFSSYGGTEREANGALAIEDTAQITTWYRPDIKASCRLKRLTDGAVFEILGEPENIEMRNMFLTFKIRRVSGGA